MYLLKNVSDSNIKQDILLLKGAMKYDGFIRSVTIKKISNLTKATPEYSDSCACVIDGNI